MPVVSRLVSEYTRGFERHAGTIPAKRKGGRTPEIEVEKEVKRAIFSKG